MDDKKKYNYLEPILNEINSKFISLSDKEIERNNIIQKEILNMITDSMKHNDSLFETMYSRVFYGGSFYDGLRVGHPDEFDLDLLMTLPKILEPEITKASVPGYVMVKMKGLDKFSKQFDVVQTHRKFITLLNDKGFLDVIKVQKWMEGTVMKGLKKFQTNGKYQFKTNKGDFIAKVCKGGPAFTLNISGIGQCKDITMDIDLVPCFVFGKDRWPPSFRENPVDSKPEFFIVPKPLKQLNSNHFWRLSFQEQERELIGGKMALKPTIKLLKQLRDNCGHHVIASYYLKTILLWMVLEQDESFWSSSLSYVFVTAFKRYKDQLNANNIPYFWDKDNNLIKTIKPETLTNLKGRIQNILNVLETKTDDPLAIAKFFYLGDTLNK